MVSRRHYNTAKQEQKIPDYDKLSDREEMMRLAEQKIFCKVCHVLQWQCRHKVYGICQHCCPKCINSSNATTAKAGGTDKIECTCMPSSKNPTCPIHGWTEQ